MKQQVIIIEDETIAAEHLKRSLLQIEPDYEVIAILQSIEESIEYFSEHPSPNLIFLDIHLADGLSLRIFDQIKLTCPIIFTTAYDQYALEAFQAGGIDYLLKPISPETLRQSLDKLASLRINSQPTPSNTPAIQQLAEKLLEARRFPSSFFITVADKLIPIQLKEVACFYLEDKISRALFYDGHILALDRPLDSLMAILNPDLFFRANRQYIVAHRAIKEITLWPIGKLALNLTVSTPDRIIISKARVSEFKQWYTH